MRSILRALPWAIASLTIAFASMLNIIPHAQATTLIAVIPALMIATMANSRCGRRERAA